MTPHDALYKELLQTFFVEFLELFFPQVLEYLDLSTLTPVDKEVVKQASFSDKRTADVLMQARFKGTASYFLIHVENQAKSDLRFGRRLLNYFVRLHELYGYPVYPIVVFSYDKPRQAAKSHYTVTFPDGKVLDFRYRVIQLNQLRWQDFLTQASPVAAALMSRMQVGEAERARVKAEAYRMLFGLGIDDDKTQFVAAFVDTYLPLNQAEEGAFKELVAGFAPAEREGVMHIMTSWEKRGLEQGREEGRVEGERNLILRQLTRRLGAVTPEQVAAIRALSLSELGALGDSLLDFSSSDDLEKWLAANPTVNS